jgi:muconate cycloisomerase
MSFGVVGHVDQIVVKVDCGDISGWGEVSVLGGPYWSGESAESVLGVLKEFLLPRTVGCGLFNLERTRLSWNSISGNFSAKCALEIALMDALGHAKSQPIAELFGGGYASVTSAGVLLLQQ